MGHPDGIRTTEAFHCAGRHTRTDTDKGAEGGGKDRDQRSESGWKAR